MYSKKPSTDEVYKGYCSVFADFLEPDETIFAVFKYDLNSKLFFSEHFVALTNRRILFKKESAINSSISEHQQTEQSSIVNLRDFKSNRENHTAEEHLNQQYTSIDLKSTLRLKLQNKSKLPYLDLYDGEKLLARWHFTGSQLQYARVFQERFLIDLTFYTEDHTHQKIVDEKNIDNQLLLEDDDLSSDSSGSAARTLLRLKQFTYPYRMQLIIAFILTLISTAARLVPPYITMPLIDKIIIPYRNGSTIDLALVGFYLSCVIVSLATTWVLSWISGYIVARVSERIAFDLRTKTYEHLLTLSQDYFSEKRSGDLFSRIGSSSDTISSFLSSRLLDFATDVLMLCMIVPVLISINFALACVTLIPLPFLMWMIYIMRARLLVHYDRIYRAWDEVSNILADTIPGIRVVKTFGQEQRELTRFKNANIVNLFENDRMNRFWALFSPTIDLVTDLGVLFVWAFGVYQIMHGSIELGVLVAFISYLGRFYSRIQSMTKITSSMERAATASRRIFSIMDRKAKVVEPPCPVPIDHIKGKLDIKGLDFSYGPNQVYKNFNLTINAGEMIGIVGRSGVGKSTLINLICRLHDPHAGAILLDGIDIRSFAVPEYRGKIGLVSQEPYLFFGTIAENISYGRTDASREDIINAARQARAHEFIMNLPQGYDSVVGERGQRLSAGQCQRLTIARALLINPSILIFDEATSSLDSHTEHEIQKALQQLIKGRTTIAIAHRLSTLRHADRIIVIENGKIIEEGTHKELMALKGAFYKAYKVQLSQEETENI